MLETNLTDIELAKFMLEVLTRNEIGSDRSKAYCFSDPDGVESGKSGYSFGRVQFDIENNWTAIDCLRACGFRPKDLDRLFEQKGPISDLNIKLEGKSYVVDRFDMLHTVESVEHCKRLIEDSDIKLSSVETFLHIVDYHSQLYMSEGGKLHRHLKSLMITARWEVDPKNILNFKLNHTKWGRERPDDVRRRFKNIEAFCETNDALKTEG